MRRYIQEAKQHSQEVFMPLAYELGKEAQVDWHEGWIEENGVERKAQFFCMRLCYSNLRYDARADVTILSQSNGKLERWHRSVKSECIRSGTPLSVEDAWRQVAGYVEHYNTVRLHSAIG